MLVSFFPGRMIAATAELEIAEKLLAFQQPRRRCCNRQTKLALVLLEFWTGPTTGELKHIFRAHSGEEQLFNMGKIHTSCETRHNSETPRGCARIGAGAGD